MRFFIVCIIHQDVPIPDFLQDRVEADWSEEEKKQALEYKRKVKELEEEREKFKKVAFQYKIRL